METIKTIKDLLCSQFLADNSNKDLVLNNYRSDIYDMIERSTGDDLLEDHTDLRDLYDQLEEEINYHCDNSVSIYTSDLLEFLADQSNSDFICEVLDEGLEIKDYQGLITLASSSWYYKARSLIYEDLDLILEDLKEVIQELDQSVM